MDILLIEDDPFDLELTLRVLQKSGLARSVTVARDGAEALECLFPTGRDPRHPRLVFLDLKLPKVDGLEVLRRLRQDPCTARIPVVVMTSSRMGSDLASAYELGVNSYLCKPVDSEEFTHMVTEAGQYWLQLNESPS